MDQGDDANVCNHVWHIGLVTMWVETGDSGKPQLFGGSQKRVGIYSWEAKQSEQSEQIEGSKRVRVGVAKATGSSGV